MKLYSVFFLVSAVVFCTTGNKVSAQQYKLRQTTSVMGMKSESTIYVKGMRKRTEGGGMMGIGTKLTTIEQCDLQRTISINDKKKLYFIESFAKESDDEVIDEDVKPVTKPKPVVTTNPQKGGIITLWYSIIDTGERKKMYGFTARHVWTNQKMKPSEDACSMKDSIIIKTDGWYIDLPQFNCPVRYRTSTPTSPKERVKQDCQDKFVTRRRGKGKLGFPLQETTTIIMNGGKSQTSEFKTDIETLEFSTMKLDSMLFEIPPGYTLAASLDELQDKPDYNEMMNQYKNMNKDNKDKNIPNDQKMAGVIRIGVYEPKGDDQIQPSALQQYLISILSAGAAEAIAVTSEEEARKNNCDYTLATEFTKMKAGGKVGGLLKAIKNADPNAASSFTIEGNMILTKLADGSVKSQPKLDGKYDGKADDAAKRALEKGSGQVLKEIK